MFTLVARDTEPFGYSIITNVRSDDAMQNIKRIQKIVELNNSAYTNHSTEMFKLANLKEKSRKRIIPQPSYRMYMFFNKDKNLEIIISPEFLSHAGVTEAAGIQTIRDVGIKPRYSDKEILADSEIITQKIKDKMEKFRDLWSL